jgi:hypothetical protein
LGLDFVVLKRTILSASAPFRLCALVSILAVAGCQSTGDFGRRKAPSTYDFVATKAGEYQAIERDEPVSGFAFTDAEKQMRASAYPFYIPPRVSKQHALVKYDLQWHRVFTANQYAISGEDYLAELKRLSPSSHTAYYQMIASDVYGDIAALPLFQARVLQVYEDDTLRLKAANRIDPNLVVPGSPALARLDENRLVVDAVRYKLPERARAYQYAYERLMVELPSIEGAKAEAAIAALNQATVELEAALANKAPGFWDKNPLVISTY